MIKIENNTFLNGQRYRLFVLLSLFLCYHNHICVSAYGRFNRRSYNAYNAMKQTGIFPRGGGGGAVNRYTDVVQIRQRTTKSPSTSSAAAATTANANAARTRRRMTTRSPSHPFVTSDHSKLPDDGSLFEPGQEEDIREQDYIEKDTTDGQDQDEQMESRVQASQAHNNVWRNILPPAVTGTLDEMFAPGALLVTGRVIATAVIYLSISRLLVFQVHNISDLRAFIVNPSNLKKLVTVPGMFLRNRIGNRNNRARDSVPENALSTSFRNEVDETEELRSEELSDSSSDSTAIEIEEEEKLEEEGAGESESEFDSLPYDNDAPSKDENKKVVQVDDAFSSFVKPVDELGRDHFHKFLFHDQINS